MPCRCDLSGSWLARPTAPTARGSAAALNLLGAVKGEVASPPTLVARASGKPGGAKVHYPAPLIKVTANGNEQALLINGSPLNFTVPANPLLQLQLRLGQNQQRRAVRRRHHRLRRRERAHGATGAAAGDPLPGGSGIEVASVKLFPMAVTATAPTGGVTCPAVDTDGDGLTDSDGINDSDEVSGRLNRGHRRHASDPTNLDTDFGRVTDGREIRAGSDPSDSKSFPRKP